MHAPVGQVPNLFTEVTEGLHPYGVASHRHMPEIEQGLSEFAGEPVQVLHHYPLLLFYTVHLLSWEHHPRDLHVCLEME